MNLWSWLKRRGKQPVNPDLAKSYQATFATPDGMRVLQHLLDTIYFIVYEGTDPNYALIHNSRRTVVQEILDNIDIGENPEKYMVKTEPSELLKHLEEQSHAD